MICNKPKVDNAKIIPEKNKLGTNEKYTVQCKEGYLDINDGKNYGEVDCFGDVSSPLPVCAGNGIKYESMYLFPLNV